MLSTVRNDKTLTVVPARVWVFDESAGTYTSDTADAGDTDDADWALFPAVDAALDASVIGAAHQFTKLVYNNAGGTAGIGGTVVFEYHAKGGIWKPCSNIVDGTTNFTIAAVDGQIVTFDHPGDDWVPVELGGSGGELYYIRARITDAYETNPVYDQVFVGTFIGGGGFDENGRVHPLHCPNGHRYVMTCAFVKIITGVASSRLVLWDADTNTEVVEILPASADVSRVFIGAFYVPLTADASKSLEVRWIVTAQTGSVRCLIDGRISL